MVWRELLLIAAVVLPFSPEAGFLLTDCGGNNAAISGCINGGVVDVSGAITSPGSGGTSSGGTSGTGGGTSAPPVVWKCMQATCPPHPDASAVAPITLRDIASFRPTPGVQYMQPDGWTVPGLDTNFYAVTAPHIVDGTLLGQPASVRFTPVRYHWAYVDGTTATLSTKGATWSALGVGEFDPTPTSHIYAVEGTYTIRLVIDFRAEYRFAGSPFYPIAGVLPLPANDLHITVDGAKTVLVEHDCGVNPAGPGC